MSQFYRNWLKIWCWVVTGFGVLLMSGAFPETDLPVRVLFGILDGPGVFAPDAHLRFSVSLMGAVTFGWGLTFAVAMRAAHMLGSAATPIWTGITVAVLVWFVVDSTLSALTGFPLNAASNAVLLAGYLVPVLASGVLQPSLRTA